MQADPSQLGTSKKAEMAEVKFENVYKYYSDIEAVKDLNLTCPDGEMLALLGPSGCGKTSTLKMVAGVEEVSKGEIRFDGRPVSRLAPGERNIAMVFEDYALYPHLSVFENIAFPLKVRHFKTDDIRTRVGEVLELLGLTADHHENVQKLSGGAQQRVSIGRALVRDPELILFDEPLSHLDGDQKVQLRSEIKRLQQSTGLTSILVTHDQTEAVAMSDKVAVMNHGMLQQVAEPEELYARPANLFVAHFIGEPPMNLLPAELAEENGQLLLRGNGWQMAIAGERAGRLKRAAPSARLVVGARPEHLDLAAHDMVETGNYNRGTIKWKEFRGDVEVVQIETPLARSGAIGEAGRGNGAITLEVAGPTPFKEGDAVAVRFREDRISLFDAETGKNLLLFD